MFSTHSINPPWEHFRMLTLPCTEAMLNAFVDDDLNWIKTIVIDTYIDTKPISVSLLL